MKFFLFLLLVGALFVILFFSMSPNGEISEMNMFPQGNRSTIIPQNAGESDISSLSCQEINWENGEEKEENIKNPYLLDAMKENGGYDPEQALTEFLDEFDQRFQGRVEALSGVYSGCELTALDVESPMDDQKIDSLEEFSQDLWNEHRKVDCAFQAMLFSSEILCSSGTMLRDSLLECDKNFREKKLENVREDLVISLEIGLMQMNELANVWPLYKRLECLNEELADQREILVDFLDVFSKFPAAFINASQSK
jgi:hypothetical protein